MKVNVKLEEYLSVGIENLVKDIVKASIGNYKETKFLVQYGRSVKRAEKIRHNFEMTGEHIPSFIIASITKTCNLHCLGCYDRANGHLRSDEMSVEQWNHIFIQAEEAGISAILLAGGEPLVRKDVIKIAAEHKSLLFPVFTNGTMIDNDYLKLFDEHRNLIPILSVEGNELHTDQRRGTGVYANIMKVINSLKENNILFGVSITVTNKNMDEVTSEAFTNNLYNQGCKAIVYVEYVPFEYQELALDENGRSNLCKKVTELRNKNSMLFISFPGDEQESGGCLAAGRGFFHINAFGDAEPCPFSPVTDANLKTLSLREVLKSPLFEKIKNSELLLEEHIGGCTLFQQKELVNSMVSECKR